MAAVALLSTVSTRLVRRRAGLAVAAVAVLGVATGGALPAGASSAAPGHWTVLGASLGVPESGTPAVWEDASHHAWILWLRKPTASTQTYEAVELAPNGSIAKGPIDVFAGHDWASLSGTPTLLASGGSPQVVFSGLDGVTGSPYNTGCVFAAVGSTVPWTLTPGSLSANCINPIGGSGESAAGVLATAFPGGWVNGHGVIDHVGISATSPATEPDGQIALPTVGVADKVGVANDVAGNGHFLVGWDRVFSKPAAGDGYYVQDITAGTPVLKAPGSGTNSINFISGFSDLNITATNTHPGVYLGYCSNGSTCKVQLWRVGAAKALTVPGPTGAYDIALSAGPAGRLWISWYNGSTNKLSVVRTNTAVTKFGPVKTYATPCFEHGLIGLSGGTAGRLDVALQCINNAKLQETELVTQSLVPLQVGLSAKSLTNTAKRSLTVSVTDVGNPVKGAKVVVAGHKATTNAKGKATITLPKGAKAGSYKVSVTATDYLAGMAGLSIKG